MKLDNFKELLTKKASGNENLQLLIKYMKEDMLAEHVIESLSKMAEIDQGRSSNDAVLHFGSRMEPDMEADMIYDALSHHASHYKAALDSGNEKLADSHMKKLFNIMYLGRKFKDKYTDHSGGKLKIDAVDPKPWERSAYQSKNDRGRFKTDTQGWKRSSNNYSWLRGAPDSSYDKETDTHGHKGAYPLEQIKVNGKYIAIDDVEPSKEHVAHPFDSHPILNYFRTPRSKFNADAMTRYLADHDKFHSDEAGFMDKWFDAVEARDPKLAESRGLEAAKAIHKELMGGDDAMKRLAEITGKKPEELAVPKAAEPQAAPAPQADTATEAAPKVEMPKQDATPAAPAGEQISGDEAMKRLKQIMGNKFKG